MVVCSSKTQKQLSGFEFFSVPGSVFRIMRIAAAIAWVKNRKRYSLAILFVAASGFAIDRWFISGLIASKWIGLPQYASAMRELQRESRTWGIVALTLEFASLALLVPRWPKETQALMDNPLLTYAVSPNARTEYLRRCVLHIGLCFLGTLVAAILIPLIAYAFGAPLQTKLH